ncbi:MAG: hypothetical protein JXA14_13755 [Anaerolineae bacterium]|nr:hypothetical protein [Anaerolineae bacterium]
MEAAFICSEELWSRGFGKDHPLRPERLKRTYDLLTAYRAFDAPTSHLVEPRPATRDELLLFHTAVYVDAVERLSAPGGEGAERTLAQRYGFRPDETPAFAGMFETEGLKVGVGLVGAELVAEGRAQVAFSIAGGMHHARPALASGPICPSASMAASRTSRSSSPRAWMRAGTASSASGPKLPSVSAVASRTSMLLSPRVWARAVTTPSSGPTSASAHTAARRTYPF